MKSEFFNWNGEVKKSMKFEEFQREFLKTVPHSKVELSIEDLKILKDLKIPFSQPSNLEYRMYRKSSSNVEYLDPNDFTKYTVREELMGTILAVNKIVREKKYEKMSDLLFFLDVNYPHIDVDIELIENLSVEIKSITDSTWNHNIVDFWKVVQEDLTEPGKYKNPDGKKKSGIMNGWKSLPDLNIGDEISFKEKVESAIVKLTTKFLKIVKKYDTDDQMDKIWREFRKKK